MSLPVDVPHEAGLRLEMILERIQRFGRPGLIPLTDYADEQTYDFLLVNPGWTFAQWRAVNWEVARQLRERGYRVQLVRVEMAEFFDWLAEFKLPNTPANRAQFVAWKAMS
ncbi:MAG: hypothetical protein HY735_22010 [Verrucomicrobia bacterium]|nr:hypothetical protein [Verrucomicrobiota bacterium]